jgi:TrmH family RNA methyltransferase
MNAISSTSNVEVKHLVHLKDKGYRYKHHQFVAEGIRTCSTLVEAGVPLLRLYVTQAAYEAHDISKLAKRFVVISNEIAKHVSSTTTPSGILGVFSFEEHNLQIHTPGLVLAQVQDPGNLGTLLRTACAFNIKHIYCIQTVDPYHPKVVQASAGALGQLFIYQAGWKDIVSAKKPTQNLCALVSKDGDLPNNLYGNNNLLVVGNEAHGLPSSWENACEKKITIPMPGNTESLNASIAGALGMYFMVQEIK